MKEFRLVLYCNAPESRRFWGGRLAVSPLAYYYYSQRHGKVFLGSSFVCQGLGRYIDCVKAMLKQSKSIQAPIERRIGGEKIRLSSVGYIYQNFDPVYDSLG